MVLFNSNRRKKRQLANEQIEGSSLISYMEPQAVQSEEFRTIRTNIEFAQVDRDLKTLLITSSIPMEGKSTISSNLAYTMAQTNGKQVLLVDTDLRKPTVHRTFRLDNEIGLTSLLADKGLPFNKVVRRSAELNMYFLPSGPIPPNPAELLASNRMSELMLTFEKHFDLVIYDAPPVNLVTDAKVLASKVDGVLLVVRQNYTKKENIRTAKLQLDKVKANILGYVLNDVDSQTDEYGYGYYGTYEENNDTHKG